MKTIQLVDNFGIERLKIVEQPQPQLTKKQVLVKIEAVSLNYVDLLVIKGLLNSNLSLPYIPVCDGAGIVEKVGEEVTAFKTGDKVATTFIPDWIDSQPTAQTTDYQTRQGLGNISGQLSQYKCFSANQLILIPSNLTTIEAATLPIAGLTAWNALRYGNLQADNTVLLHGTGGVSIFALQFAKARGAKVIITSSNEKKLQKAQQLGADLVINHQKDANWETTVRNMTEGKGADVIVETVGGSNLERSLNALRMGGYISVVELLDGFKSNIDVLALIHQQATLRGLEVGGTHQFKAMNREIEAKEIHPIIDRVFSWEEIKAAFEYLEKGLHFGKVIVSF
ncbi:NAD(P)-dependent alcohol dehydrogenase [Pleurocapsa sp. PCC 7319]|uniref:zinc-dependent alcohol dehydrogenase family protein n=1 Tax=Pleurocapsa sp. PCC 7319 TaxID=118161 RepID=UPI0003481EC6|nr:NAD(P)-dependent alcohol dehydrogenase [Pleurocapsa sp. PCC 7319]